MNDSSCISPNTAKPYLFYLQYCCVCLSVLHSLSTVYMPILVKLLYSCLALSYSPPHSLRLRAEAMRRQVIGSSLLCPPPPPPTPLPPVALMANDPPCLLNWEKLKVSLSLQSSSPIPPHCPSRPNKTASHLKQDSFFYSPK